MELITTHDQNKAMWTVMSGGRTLLEYVYGEEDDPNPSFRVARTAAGHDIALYRPWDHPWHTGLFFSWKYLNGLNFWESMYHGKRNVAVTREFTVEASGRTGFKQHIDYATYAGDILLHEERRVTIESLDNNGYVIHWEGDFSTEGNNVILDRTEVGSETPWGGYAGLSCRLPRTLLGPVITTDQGETTAEDAHNRAFSWCDYTGRIDGFVERTYAGVCVMSHPLNLRHPSPMLTYDYKDMQFLQAAFLQEAPLVLNAGELLRLRYVLYVHDGKLDPQHLANLYSTLFIRDMTKD